jgi:hypothetical protein
LGIGDWGLGIGIGDWGLGPIPQPKTPNPNPQSPFSWNSIKINLKPYHKKIKIKFKKNINEYKML